jgi:hypothetical protein
LPKISPQTAEGAKNFYEGTRWIVFWILKKLKPSVEHQINQLKQNLLYTERQLLFEHHTTQYIYENIIVRSTYIQKNRPTVCFFIANDIEISIVNTTRQYRVPFPFLKPYWVGDSMPFPSAQKSKLVHIIFSMTFLPQASILIALYEPNNKGSLPGLTIGTTFVRCQADTTWPSLAMPKKEKTSARLDPDRNCCPDPRQPPIHR